MRVLLLLLLAASLAGCAVYKEPGPRDVEGPTDGYAPTASFLKVFVKQPDGSAISVDFDRRDWYVAELAHRLDVRNVTFLAAHGQERSILSEVVADVVATPSDVQALKYDAMHATAQQRSLMDLEYADLLRARAPSAPVTTSPSSVVVPIST